MARTSGVSMAGCTWISVTPGAERRDRLLDPRPAAGPRARARSGRGRRRPPRRRAGGTGSRRRARSTVDGSRMRQAELDGQLDVDVEELRPQRHGREVRREVADVEAPHDGPLDLGPALAAHLVEVGVVPEVVDGAGEAAVAVEQRRRVGERAPAVQLVLGVEREVHADVLAAVAGGRLAGPRRRHHQRGARGRAVRAAPSNTPTLMAWQAPRSSQLTMTRRSSAR